MAKKRGRAWTIIVLGLAAYGGYVAWQVGKTTENARKVVETTEKVVKTIEKHAAKENLDKARGASKDAKKAVVKKYDKLKSHWITLKDKAGCAYKKGKREWNKPLSDSREKIPSKKQMPVLTDKGLKWGNVDDFE